MEQVGDPVLGGRQDRTSPLTAFVSLYIITKVALKFYPAIPSLLPPRSMVGQLTLDQHIGVRIPGGQPKIESKAV